MFKITGYKNDINVKECVVSTESELPNKESCIRMGVGIASEAFIIDTAEAAILNDGYVWTKV